MGVKQGCLLSTILFAYFLNDLHDSLQGGIVVENMNIRILLYADDVVIFSDNPGTLSQMISNLERYCELWNLKVNLLKSKIMIFNRGGGRRKVEERWSLHGEQIEVVGEYKYLGITLTPKLSFSKHLDDRLDLAKLSLNVTWNSFMMNRQIVPSAKYKAFQAVSRSILCYGAEVWGFRQYEQVEKLLRFFLKKLFGLPRSTPNYMLNLETGIPDIYMHTFKCHYRYIVKALNMPEDRLPHILSKIVAAERILWYEDLLILADRHTVNLDLEGLNMNLLKQILLSEEKFMWNKKVERAKQGIRHEPYNKLNYSFVETYFNDNFDISMIRYIFKCRGGLLNLNSSPWHSGTNICSLCNLDEEETIFHFVAVCPVLAEFRFEFFNTRFLLEDRFLNILNGENWIEFYKYLKVALRYRKFLVDEFNC